MRPEEWEASGRRLSVQGRLVFFKGGPRSSEPTLCLHGFPTSSFDYHKIWSELEDSLDPIAFDLIGYGFSQKPKDFPYTTFSQADILEGVIAEMGIERVHVLSHDYGNTITQELLAREHEGRLPFEILSICFMNGALFPETHRPILAQKILIGPVGPLFGRIIPESAFKKSLASVFGPESQPTSEELDDFVSIFRKGGGKAISHKLIQYMRERQTHRERWVSALQKMEQPFRFINGTSDPVSGKHLVDRFRELVPGQIDIFELEGIGHFPHFESPRTVTDLYRAFRENILQKS